MKKTVRTRTFGAMIAAVVALLATCALLPSRALAEAPSVSYSTHVQTYGWQDWRSDGAMAGTEGESKRLESIKIKVDGGDLSGDVVYKVHRQTYGWQEEVANGAEAGTVGESKRLEGIEIRLTDELSEHYDVMYRVHVQTYGWQDWRFNGELAGTTGESKRLEGIEIRLVEKDDRRSLPGRVNYSTHVQTYGWLDWSIDGNLSGTTGESKRLEGIKIEVNPSIMGTTGGIRYKTHVQTYGWQEWAYNGAISGTTGESKRLEGIQIELTGELADEYDVWYCTHVQTYGWQEWVKNGAMSGTSGESKRLEGIMIKLLEKGSEPPINDVDVTPVPIMGDSEATQADCVELFNETSVYPSDVYAGKGAATINDFVRIMFEEAEAEGVRPDVVFSQTMLETAWLKFGGDVHVEQCNFAGIGATGGGVPGHTFADVREGLRAQVQHLKAYASTDDLVNECVDPRFHLVQPRGVAPTLGGLSRRWATGSDYGNGFKAIF